MEISDFDYELPSEMIAQEAVHPADSCKLMVLGNKVEHKIFSDIVEYFREGDVIVVNETKVSHAKIIGKKSTGGKVEVILTKPLGGNTYKCRIKGTNVKVGTRLEFNSTYAEIVEKKDDVFILKFCGLPSEDEMVVPTPPYIKKKVPEEDYQTMFALREGSLAAPTAALHFTPELVKKIKAKGVKFAKVILHIGFGTFLPARDLNNPKTEPEFFEVSQEAADLINNAKRIIAVGTTSVKALESAAHDGNVRVIGGWSDIFIKPGYRFKMKIDVMVTNFHLPKSSLLMLVCAYAGTERIMKAYEEAVDKNYRFYSLGDAMIIFRNQA